MPELPEVEITRRGLEPHIVNRQVISIHIYKKQLRWEIPAHLVNTLKNIRAQYWLVHPLFLECTPSVKKLALTL